MILDLLCLGTLFNYISDKLWTKGKRVLPSIIDIFCINQKIKYRTDYNSARGYYSLFTKFWSEFTK